MYRQTTLNKPKITAIVPHAENAGLRDLFVDGAFYCTVPAALLMQQGLGVGDCFDEQALESLTFAAKLIPAKEKAYQYLEYGDLSRKKLYTKLVQYGIEEPVAEAACSLMEEQGFIDDGRLAESMAHRFAGAKRWGPRRILPEMVQRGIPPELAKEAVAMLDWDYTESIRHYLETKYRRADLSDRKERARVCQGLQRLGFEFEDINSVIIQFTEE